MTQPCFWFEVPNEYVSKIKDQYGIFDAVLDWLNANCDGWNWNYIIDKTGKRRFFFRFTSEDDYALLKLKFF